MARFADAIRLSQEAVAAALRRRFPSTLVLPTLGNHDTHPYFTSGTSAAAALSTLARLYGDRLPSPALRRQLAQRGYYVYRQRRRRLWVAVLETNALALPEAAHAADEQLSWLGRVLSDAADARATVLVLGHIAPGASHVDWQSMAASGWAGGGWTARAQQRLYELMRRDAARPHGGTLAGLLFGHLHTGSVRLIEPLRGGGGEGSGGGEGGGGGEGSGGGGGAGDGHLPAVVHLSPSLTARNPTPHVPALRRYELRLPRAPHRGVGALHDAIEHAFELDASNAGGTAVWAAHSVRAALNLSDFSRGAWRRWARRLLDDDRAFGSLMSAQRCADEIEADYATCKVRAPAARIQPLPQRTTHRARRRHPCSLLPFCRSSIPSRLRASAAPAHASSMRSTRRLRSPTAPRYLSQASMVCAMLEAEAVPYAECLQTARQRAKAPPGWRPAVKRQP